MARTTEILVKGVLLADYDTGLSPSLVPFIDIASSIVDDVAACALDKGVTLSTAKLELMERWLAAHFYVMTDQTYKSKKTGDAAATFQGETKMYLTSSKYGQSAIVMDPTGCLAAQGNMRVATMAWLGMLEQEQQTYNERNVTSLGD